MTTFKMIAKTFKGLEEVLAEELTNLGANDIEIGRRAVSFTGDKALLYKANLWLRTASRILMPITSFKASNPDEVYNAIRQIDWEKYMDLSTTFSIDSTVFSDSFHHSKFVTYRVKDAIVDQFQERHQRRPNVSVTNPGLMINIHIANETVTVSLDSSGPSLHKRGWRVRQTEAPINEALAAGMLLLAGWNGQSDFCDPMCGSGTLLIEAAMIALNIPPGIYRQGFAFEKWKDFDADLFDELYNDDSEEREFTHHIYGSDLARQAIQVAQENIKSAGLAKYITVETKPIQELEPQTHDCLLVTNPPYGERIKPEDIFDLYGDLGRLLKFKFPGSTAWVISSADSAMQKISLKPSKKIELLNGDLECSFNRYDLFSGTNKEYKTDKAQGTKHQNRPSTDKPRYTSKPTRPAYRHDRNNDQHNDRRDKRTTRPSDERATRPFDDRPARPGFKRHDSRPFGDRHERNDRPARPSFKRKREE